MGYGENDFSMFVESDGTHEKVYEVLIIENGNATICYRRIKKVADAAMGVGKSFERVAHAMKNLQQLVQSFEQVP